MQALRNEVLEDLRAELPAPEDIPENEVRDYYSKHRADFVEPERRRVLVIETGDQKRAKEVAEKAQGADGKTWAELARKVSLRRDRLGPEDANELAGDLGFVSAPGASGGENVEVPESVRKAVFELQEVGDVAARPSEASGHYFVVRLGGVSPARERSVRDAGPAIRAELLRLKFAEAEKKLLAELEKRYPANIDEAALKKAAERATKRAAEGAPKKAAEGAPKKPAEGAPKKAAEGAPKKAAEGAPKKAAEGAPQ